MKKAYLLGICLCAFRLISTCQVMDGGFNLTDYLSSSREEQIEIEKEIFFAEEGEVEIILDSIFDSNLCNCSCNYRKDKIFASCQLLFFMGTFDRLELMIWDYATDQLDTNNKSTKKWANCFLAYQDKLCNSNNYRRFIDSLPKMLLEYDSSDLYYASDLTNKLLFDFSRSDIHKCHYLINKVKRDTVWRRELAKSLITQYHRYKNEDYDEHISDVLSMMYYVPDALTTEFIIEYLNFNEITHEIADLIVGRIRYDYFYPPPVPSNINFSAGDVHVYGARREDHRYDDYLGRIVYLSDEQVKYLKTRLTPEYIVKQNNWGYYDELIRVLQLE